MRELRGRRGKAGQAGLEEQMKGQAGEDLLVLFPKQVVRGALSKKPGGRQKDSEGA